MKKFILFLAISQYSILNTQYSIYPNPVKENLNILVTLNRSETVKISLLNELGQEIIYPAQPMVKGKNTFNINTSEIPNGVYYVRVIAGEEKPQHLRFVKME